jgi:hypothetical protein
MIAGKVENDGEIFDKIFRKKFSSRQSQGRLEVTGEFLIKLFSKKFSGMKKFKLSEKNKIRASGRCLLLDASCKLSL